MVSHYDHETPSELKSEIDNGWHNNEELDFAYLVYRALVAIDKGIERQHPRNVGRRGPSSSCRLLEEFDKHARFNTDAVDGYVLPKVSHKSYRGAHLADRFNNLVRAKVNRNEVRVLGQTGRMNRARPKVPTNPEFVVVPFLYTLFEDDDGTKDVCFSGLEMEGGHYFQIRHNDRKWAELEDRVRSAVDAIRASRVTIAIFPELALDDRLTQVLRDHLHETDSMDASLEWVIVGASLPTRQPNKWPSMNVVQVFQGGGDIVAFPLDDGRQWTWCQANRHPYKLSKWEQTKYDLSSCFTESYDREEAISLGDCLYVFDQGISRYAVVICEDLAQYERTVQELRKLRCNVLITVVMDGPVKESGWASKRAAHFVVNTGGFAIVANSLLLPNIPKVRDYIEGSTCNPDGYPAGKKPVGTLVIPEDEKDPSPELLVARATPEPGNESSLVTEPLEIPVWPLTS